LAAGLGLLLPRAMAADAREGGAPVYRGVASQVLVGYSYQLPPPARLAVPVLTANPPPGVPASDDIVQLAPFLVSSKPDQTFRDLNNAVAQEKLSIPCDLFVRNSGPTLQLRFLGAPVNPVTVKYMGVGSRANFPFVTVAW
jgi:hypothetical protein